MGPQVALSPAKEMRAKDSEVKARRTMEDSGVHWFFTPFWSHFVTAFVRRFCCEVFMRLYEDALMKREARGTLHKKTLSS